MQGSQGHQQIAPGQMAGQLVQQSPLQQGMPQQGMPQHGYQHPGFPMMMPCMQSMMVPGSYQIMMPGIQQVSHADAPAGKKQRRLKPQVLEDEVLNHNCSVLGGGQGATVAAARAIPLVERKSGLQHMDARFKAGKIYGWSQRDVDMAIFVGSGLSPAMKRSPFKLPVKGDYRRLQVESSDDKGKPLSSVAVDRKHVTEAALAAGWETDWDAIYPKAELNAAVTVGISTGAQPMSFQDPMALSLADIEQKITYYRKLKELKELQEGVGNLAAIAGPVGSGSAGSGGTMQADGVPRSAGAATGLEDAVEAAVAAAVAQADLVLQGGA